jgi:pyruvate/2-oxoglutarate dehydrogenase complex dihydrolipoamide dehydrogenase (E3) component
MTKKPTGDGHPLIRVTISGVDGEKKIEVEALLLATGRQPNVDSLGLEAAGVKYHLRDGIYVNEYLETSNPNIYAVGDCLAMGQSDEVSGPGF